MPDAVVGTELPIVMFRAAPIMKPDSLLRNSGAWGNVGAASLDQSKVSATANCPAQLGERHFRQAACLLGQMAKTNGRCQSSNVENADRTI